MDFLLRSYKKHLLANSDNPEAAYIINGVDVRRNFMSCCSNSYIDLRGKFIFSR